MSDSRKLSKQGEITHPYCRYVLGLEDTNLHKSYHDNRYGFRIQDDNELFGRLLLEINQAGLSWDLILKKEENFRLAFDNFDIQKVANYQQEKIDDLLQNKSIIRNKLKINAAIYNANSIIEIQKKHGSFYAWLCLYEEKKMQKVEWVKLFKQHFKFTGGEIVGEFLMSTGFLEGAHDKNCSVFNEIKK